MDSALPATPAARLADLRGRVFTTLILLAGYRLLCFVPLIGIRLNVYRLLVMPDNPSPPGAWVPAVAWRSLSIMSYGLQPFITAMVLGLLARKAIPGFAARIEARGGWSALESWARRATVPLSLLQGWFVLGGIDAHDKAGLIPRTDFLTFVLPNIALLLAGTAIAVWIAGVIDRRGLGNGVLTLVAFDGIARLAQEARIIPEILRLTGTGRVPFLLHILAALALFALVATLFRASLKIPLLRTNGPADPPPGPEAPLALGFCPAGAWPLLGAAVVSELPRSFWLILGPWARVLLLGDRDVAGVLVHAAVVFILAIASADVGSAAKRVSDLFRTRGLSIEGVRPGRRTRRALANAAFRLAFVGAIAQGVLLALGAFVAYGWSGDAGSSPTAGRFTFVLAAATIALWIRPVTKALAPIPAQASPSRI